jgi:hypothetical protein
MHQKMKHYLISVFFAYSILLFGFSPFAHAQSDLPIHISLLYNPDLPSSMGSPMIFLGTPENPVHDISEIHFTLPYDTLLDISDFELGGDGWESFFNPDGNCEASITCDASTQSMEISIWRTNDEAQSGEGEVMYFGGVGIIDNIDLKCINITLKSVDVRAQMKPKFYCEGDFIHFTPQHAGLATVWGIGGQLYLQQNLNPSQSVLDISTLPRGLYLFRFEGGNQTIIARFYKAA